MKINFNSVLIKIDNNLIVNKIDKNNYEVINQIKSSKYFISLIEGAFSCDCMFYAKKHRECKHIYAVREGYEK